MFFANKRDLLVKSLSGDWRSRAELYKRSVHANARIRCLCVGVPCPDVNDFLHDCFANILRTGHSFNQEDSFSEWVKSVAVWTALERDRKRDFDGAGDRAFVRLCAVEGDEPAGRERLTSYVPPRSDADDSLSSRMATLVGEPEYTLLLARSTANTTWEDAAAAAGRSINTIGPMLVRAVDRLSRCFGAPPPLNEDLEPVFPDVRPEDPTAGKTEQLQPAGRVVSMQLDRPFYPVTSEMRKIGLSLPSEVRTIALWDAARTSGLPATPLREHLDQCHYCSEVLRSLRLYATSDTQQGDCRFCLLPWRGNAAAG